MRALTGGDGAWCDRPRWRGFKAVAELVGILGGVVGVGFVGYQLLVAQQDTRAERSFAMIERFNGEVLFGATEALRRVTYGISQEIAGLDSGFTAEQSRLLVEAALFDDPENGPGEIGSLVALARFFDEVQLCIDKNLCARDSLCEYLQPVALELHDSFGSSLERYRTLIGRARLGRGIGVVAAMQCAPL